MNAYIYTANNPLNYVDPLGLILCNNSNGAVYVKPEGGTPIWVPPHSCYYRDIDGVQPPAWFPDWYKVSGKAGEFTTDVEIDRYGKPRKTGGAGKNIPDFCDLGATLDRRPFSAGH